MEYENVDEVARRQACERLKQIVKAIKAIKIKYYLNFSKISEKDKETYQKLEENLEKISNSHNLNNLKVALMSEISAKYDNKNFEQGEQGKKNEPDEILQACYGAVDAEIDALSKGRITQAIRCQEQLKKYRKQLDVANNEEIKNYKREKLAELGITREQVEERMKSWNNQMKCMFKIKHVTQRDRIASQITELDGQGKITIEEIKEEETVK